MQIDRVQHAQRVERAAPVRSGEFRLGSRAGAARPRRLPQRRDVPQTGCAVRELEDHQTHEFVFPLLGKF